MYCGQCGGTVGEQSRFCSECGAAVGADAAPSGVPTVSRGETYPVGEETLLVTHPPEPTTETTLPPPGGGHRRRLIVEIAAVAVLVVGLVGATVFLMAGGGSSSTKATTRASSDTSAGGGTGSSRRGTSSESRRASSGSATSTTATTAVPTTLDPVGAARAADPSGYAFMQQMETLLQRAQTGRSEIGPLIAAVQNDCSRDPNDGVIAINSVVANRQSVLNQLASTSTSGSSFEADLVTQFERAMSTSIEADRAYARWLQTVRDYYYRPPQGCDGSPPLDSNWDDAQAAERQVTPAKADFVAAYNAQAARFGLRTWSVDEV